MSKLLWKVNSQINRLELPVKEIVRRSLTNFYLLTRERQIQDDYKLSNGFKRIYHFHIRKNAGSSLNSAFLSLGGESDRIVSENLSRNKLNITTSGDKVFVNWNKTLINRGCYFYAHAHHPQHALNIPPDTYTIAIFRDPVNRVVSHYKMLAEFLADNPHSAKREVAKELLWMGNSFSDFIRYIPREHLQRQLYMFSKSFNIDEAYENISRLSYFFFVESFGEGIHFLSRELQLRIKIKKKMVSGKKVNISEEDLAVLREKLSDEYVLIEKLVKLKGMNR